MEVPRSKLDPAGETDTQKVVESLQKFGVNASEEKFMATREDFAKLATILGDYTEFKNSLTDFDGKLLTVPAFIEFGQALDESEFRPLADSLVMTAEFSVLSAFPPLRVIFENISDYEKVRKAQGLPLSKDEMISLSKTAVVLKKFVDRVENENALEAFWMLPEVHTLPELPDSFGSFVAPKLQALEEVKQSVTDELVGQSGASEAKV